MPQRQDDTSEFNMGLAYLETLRFILNSADRAAISLNAHGWLHCLMALRRELSDDMDEKQLGVSAAHKERIIQLLSKYSQGKSRNIHPELYSELEGLEIYLRKIMRTKGYKTRYQVGAGSALQA